MPYRSQGTARTGCLMRRLRPGKGSRSVGGSALVVHVNPSSELLALLAYEEGRGADIRVLMGSRG